MSKWTAATRETAVSAWAARTGETAVSRWIATGWRALLLIVLAVGVSTCEGGGTDPTVPTDPTEPTPDPADPGFVTIEFATPEADIGALMFILTGVGVDSLTSQTGEILDTEPAGANSLRVLMVGDFPAGTVARFWMPDRRKSLAYSVVIQQAAARTTYEQRDSQSNRLFIRSP